MHDRLSNAARGAEGESRRAIIRGRAVTPIVVIGIASLVVLTFAPDAGAFAIVAVSITIYVSAQVLSPRFRLNLSTPLTPLNIGLVLFSGHLIVLPLLGMYAGFARGTLLFLPSAFAINFAIIIACIAYISYCVGFTVVDRTVQKRRRVVSKIVDTVPRWLLGVSVAGGVVGFALSYGRWSNYIDYLSSPTVHAVIDQSLDATVQGAAALFLKPCWTFALVLWWSRSLTVDSRRGARAHFATLGVTLGLIVINASYNRASTLAPLVALAAAYSARVRRVAWWPGITAAAGILVVALFWGEYRSSGLDLAEAATAPELWAVSTSHVSDFLQVYGGGPQFLGNFVERFGFGDTLLYGRGLFSSLMDPVPILGKPFRASSDVALYNKAIYGELGFLDQIVPFQGELFVNFHFIGVVVGFTLLGAIVARLEIAFEGSISGIDAFTIYLISIWVQFLVVGSLAVTSQIFIYFMLPYYAYFVLRKRGPSRGAVTSEECVGEAVAARTHGSDEALI